MNWNKNNWQEIYKNLSPEMKEQMMNLAKAKLKEKLAKIFSQPILIVAAIFIGILAGALSAFFGQVLLKVTEIRQMNPLIFIPLLAAAGFVIVFCYKKFGKNTDRGMSLIFDVSHHKENEIPLRMIPMVAVSTWVTHLFGGSAGREGVAMQMGSALGYNISKKLPIENAGKILLVSGMAAGFAGLFQTPMAAITLALEILLVGHLELAALLPITVAAFSACKVSELLHLEKFSVQIADSINVTNLIWQNESLNVNFILKLVVLGILFGIIGGGFAKLLKLAQSYVSKKFPNPLKRIVFVGIGLSALLLIFYQGRYAGLGTNLIDLCFDATPEIFAFDWLLKFALTIATVAVGFKGGEVTPLFAIGATFGAYSANLVGVPLPLAAALGYAAVFGAATNTLFAPIFIGAEVFGFDTLPAFFIACVIAFACNGGQSIYPQKKLRIK